MKHCLPDPKAEEQMGGGYFTVFSCEFDNGKRATGNSQILRIGEDGKIMLFLCESCLKQLQGQFLYQLALDAMRTDHKLLEALIGRAIRFTDHRNFTVNRKKPNTDADGDPLKPMDLEK
jgi:hypothetical protein